MSNIVFTGCYKPLSDEDICSFENWLTLDFPPKYRNFLLTQNGGHPHKHLLPECYLEGFYSVIDAEKNISLKYNIETWRDELPQRLIPIGYAGNGDTICLSVSDDKIYLYEHEMSYETKPVSLRHLLPLAMDIDDLLGKLQGDDPAAPDDELTRLGRWADVELLDQYINAGNDINNKSSSGGCIVLHAVYEGQLDFVKECVNRGAHLKDRGLLHAAAFIVNLRMVEYLLDQGVDPNEIDARGKRPLDCMLKFHRNGPAAQLLKSKGAESSK